MCPPHPGFGGTREGLREQSRHLKALTHEWTVEDLRGSRLASAFCSFSQGVQNFCTPGSRRYFAPPGHRGILRVLKKSYPETASGLAAKPHVLHH